MRKKIACQIKRSMSAKIRQMNVRNVLLQMNMHLNVKKIYRKTHIVLEIAKQMQCTDCLGTTSRVRRSTLSYKSSSSSCRGLWHWHTLQEVQMTSSCVCRCPLLHTTSHYSCSGAFLASYECERPSSLHLFLLVTTINGLPRHIGRHL